MRTSVLDKSSEHVTSIRCGRSRRLVVMGGQGWARLVFVVATFFALGTVGAIVASLVLGDVWPLSLWLFPLLPGVVFCKHEIRLQRNL